MDTFSVDTIPAAPSSSRSIGGGVLGRPLGRAMKGLPVPPAGAVVGDVAGLGWTLHDLVPPVAVLRRSAVEHNVALMADYCARHGVLLAPHGKTTMAPQLVRQQLDAGAWGVTTGSPVQTRTLATFGVPRILLAHQVADPSGAAMLAGLLGDHPELQLLVLADSLAGVAALDEALTAAAVPRPLDVLVEVGVPGGRTGCRTIDELRAVAQAVSSSGSLRLAGVEGYEGVIDRGDVGETMEAVDRFLDTMVAGLEDLSAAGLLGGDAILSAGGSVWFDRVVDRFAGAGAGVRTVLRSGCYVAHDHGRYRRLSPLDGRAAAGEQRLRPALEVWAAVVSRPEPDMVVLDAGRRDLSFDAGLPVVVKRVDAKTRAVVDLPEWWEVVRLMDQHAMVRVPPAAGIGPGDLVALGISHPCTTFDKWPLMPVVDDEYRVVDAVVTFF